MRKGIVFISLVVGAAFGANVWLGVRNHQESVALNRVLGRDREQIGATRHREGGERPGVTEQWRPHASHDLGEREPLDRVAPTSFDGIRKVVGNPHLQHRSRSGCRRRTQQSHFGFHGSDVRPQQQAAGIFSGASIHGQQQRVALAPQRDLPVVDCYDRKLTTPLDRPDEGLAFDRRDALLRAFDFA